MKNDSLCLRPAAVQVEKVKYSKGKDLGIDFTNEIDAWAKMEFKYRKQIKQLQQYGTLADQETLKDLKTLVYAIRERLDEIE